MSKRKDKHKLKKYAKEDGDGDVTTSPATDTDGSEGKLVDRERDIQSKNTYRPTWR